MKLLSLKFKGFGPYSDAQEITFPHERKVAVLGENGAGKTFLLDSIPAALFKMVPNRKGGFYEQFSGNDAYIDLTFEMNGDTIQAKRLINANSRTQKAFLYKNGEVLCDGKDAAFSAEIQKLGINETSFLAAVYQTQNGTGNALNMDVDARIKLLSLILGLAKFEEEHAKVVEACKVETRTLDDLTLRQAELENQLPNVSTLTLQKTTCLDHIKAADECLQGYEAELEAATQAVANAKANAQGVDDLKREVTNLETEIQADQAKQADLQERIKNNQELIINRADQIRQAVTDTEAAQLCIKNNQEAIAKSQEVLTAWHEQKQKEREEANRLLTGEREKFNAAQAQLLAREGELRVLQDESKKLQAQKAANEQTIANLRPSTEIIGQVPCQGMDINASCDLLKNAHANVSKISSLMNENHAIVTEMAALDGRIQAKFNEVEGARAEVEAQRAQSVKTEAIVNETLNQRPPAEPQLAINAAQEAITAYETQIKELAGLVKYEPQLATAEERVAFCEKDLAVIAQRLQVNAQALADKQVKITEASNLEETIRQAEQKKQVVLESKRQTEADKANWISTVGSIDAQLKKAGEMKAQIDDLTQQVQAQRSVLAELQILREGLGPKGAKNVKIDAAGKAITERANRLIRIGMGPKFSICIKTLRELQSKDENGEREVRETLELKIINSETGEETLIENLSGGEKAMVALVFSLSLAIEQREASGLDVRTLILDEPSAGLSEENSIKYLDMLDQVLDETGLEQVFFISHMPVMQNLADASIFVRKGREGESSKVGVACHA